MRNLPSVDEWIRDVLSGSGLPMNQRADIADEWRDHLLERMDTKRANGMTLDDAVRTALVDFGNPVQLRRQLRGAQRARDLRSALAKTRPIAAWTIGGALCAGGVAAMFLPTSAPVAHRLMGGCGAFLAIALFAIVPAFLASLVELRVVRSQPVDEFHPLRSFVRWSLVVGAFLTGTALSPIALVGLCGYFAPDSVFLSTLHPNPEIMYGAPWLIWRNIAVAACEVPVRSFVIPTLMILAGAFAITLYERSRCVDTPPDDEPRTSVPADVRAG